MKNLWQPLENSCFEYQGHYWQNNAQERKPVCNISKLVTTPYNQVLETAQCKHIFILVKGKNSEMPFRPFLALFEDVTPLIKCYFCKIHI